VAQVGCSIGSLASELAHRAYIDTATAKPADFRADIERRRDLFLETPFHNADRARLHLFFAHAYAQTAQNAVFVAGREPHLLDFEDGHTDKRSSIIIFRASMTLLVLVLTFKPCSTG
jgi:2-methylcitrate dehydratase PrpD